MSILDVILATAKDKAAQQVAAQQAQQNAMNQPATAPLIPAQVGMVPPMDNSGPVHPLIQALTNGGGLMNRIKNARYQRENNLNSLDNL